MIKEKTKPEEETFRALVELVEEKHQAFNNVGRPSTRRDIYVEELDKRMLEVFGRKDFLQVKYILGIFQKGLNAAKEGHINRAELEFNKGQVLIEGVKDENLKGLLETIIFPNVAYLLHKKKDFEEALSMTFQTIDKLEEYEPKYPFFHMGKIQQLHNVCRVHLRTGNYKAFEDWTVQTLEYMVKGAPPSYGRLWGAGFLQAVPPELFEEMFKQVFNESVYSALLIGERKSSALLERLFHLFEDAKYDSFASFFNIHEYQVWCEINKTKACSLQEAFGKAAFYFKEAKEAVSILEFYIFLTLFKKIKTEKIAHKSLEQDITRLIGEKYSHFNKLASA